ASQSGTGTWAISGSAPNQTLSYSAASLAGGSNGSVHVTSSTSTASCGSYSNSATATSSNNGSASAGPVVITVTCAPDLIATKTNDVSGLVVLGNTFHWTIVIKNQGSSTATFASGQALLTDNLPSSGATYGTPTVTP